MAAAVTVATMKLYFGGLYLFHYSFHNSTIYNDRNNRL